MSRTRTSLADWSCEQSRSDARARRWRRRSRAVLPTAPVRSARGRRRPPPRRRAAASVEAEVVEQQRDRQDRGGRVGLAAGRRCPARSRAPARTSTGWCRSGLRLPLAASPMPPVIAAARSVRMSPNRLSVTIDVEPLRVGDQEDRRRVDVQVVGRRRPGTPRATSAKVRAHRSPACTSTLVLCTSVSCLRGRGCGPRERVPDDPLDAVRRVDADLGGDLVPACRRAATPPLPTYGPSVPSRTTTKSISPRVRQRGGDARVELRRAQVDVVVEGEAQLQQQAALEHAGRARSGRRPRRAGSRRARAAPRARRRAASRRWRASAGRRGRTRSART